MVAIALILFVLARYHSPQLAGLTAFLAVTPGLVVSPIAGALLDRYGRSRLVMLDNLIAAATGLLIAGLSWRHELPAPLLLVIVFVSSLTFPLSNSGARALFPILAPRHLWERANALDSSGHVIATLLGAPLAGALVGFAGPEWAIATTGVGYVAAALRTGRRDTRGRERQLMSGPIIASAAAMAFLPFAGSIGMVLAVMVVIGFANGPFDVALFTLRQRRTDPAWFGRAFAISMSVNWIGSPIGSALAGPVIAWSLDAALWAAVAIALFSALFPIVAVPAGDETAAQP